jgi:hypothetical protein
MKDIGNITIEFFKPSEIMTFFSWVIHINLDYKVFRLFGITFKFIESKREDSKNGR